MSNLWPEEDGVHTVTPGAHITTTIAEAIALSAQTGQPISFIFNKVIITVHSDSDPKLIHRDFRRAIEGYIAEKVGPYPNPVLTDEEKASDARVEAENKRRQQEQETPYEAKDRARREAIQAKLASAPAMELVNEMAWQRWSQRHPISATYAESWARLMQLGMAANGKDLADIAEATLHEAGLESNTNLTDRVVSILEDCWVHGKQLKLRQHTQ